MTSQSTSIYTPFADGRTVHDIVEHSPALVSERWCRNLLRQVLQSLDQQYASGAPHRRISPDTLVMLNNGEALLLPSSEDGVEVVNMVDAADATQSGETTLAADLHALATVVHYAITAELPPDGPIGPRLYDDYSDELTQGIDRCLGPNLRLRPKTIPEMRTLLGLEPPEQLAPVARTDDAATDAAAPTPSAGLDAGLDAAPPAPTMDDGAHDGVMRFDEASSASHGSAFLAEPMNAPAAPVDPLPRDGSASPVPTDFSSHDGIASPAPSDVSLRDGVASATPADFSSRGGVAPPFVPGHAPDGVGAPHAPQPPQAQPATAKRVGPAAHVKAVPPAAAAAGKRAGTQSRTGGGHGRVQRWAMMAGAAVVLLAAGSALVAFLQQSDSRDVVPLSLPPAADVAQESGNNAAQPAPAAVVAEGAAGLPADPNAAATLPEAMPGAVLAPPGAPAPVSPAAVPGAVNAARSADAVVNGTTYKLLIKPWGTVYVNGVDRGVSPPVKRLTLGPGTHTIRIVNPNFPEHERMITAGTEEGATIEHDFTAQAE